jgi:hypothetical protein
VTSDLTSHYGRSRLAVALRGGVSGKSPDKGWRTNESGRQELAALTFARLFSQICLLLLRTTGNDRADRRVRSLASGGRLGGGAAGWTAVSIARSAERSEREI